MNSNISRRQFILSMLSASAAAGSAGFVLGSRYQGIGITSNIEVPESTNINFYGTATLDVGYDGWASLEQLYKAALLFKDNGNDAGPVIAQMTAGSAATDYDLGGLLGGAETILARSGSILPWDMSKIPNWNTAWQWAKDIKHVRWQDKQYGIPLVVNADSMIYLPDKIKSIEGYESGVIDSYSAVFDPRLKGKTAMEDAWVNSVIFTAIYLKENNLLAIEEPGNLTETELKGVMEFLIEKKKEGQFRKFWNGWEQGVEVIQSGEVWVMTGWEPIVKALVDKGINAKYAIPKEGYEGWSIDLLLHAGAEKHGTVDICHQIANWLHAGQYGALLAGSRGYAVPNDTTAKFVQQNKPQNEQQVLDTIKHVKDKAFKSIYWQNVRPDNYKLYEEWWSKLRSIT